MELFVIWLLFGCATAYVATNRGGNGVAWFIFGVLLGPIALLAAFLNGKNCPACAKKISAKAIICPYCRSDVQVRLGADAVGAPTSETVVVPATSVTRRGVFQFIGIVLVLFIGCIGYAALELNREMNRTDGSKATFRSELEDVAISGVTKANFDRIETGMSYPEVVSILGKSGEELSRVELAGIVTVMYSWKKPLSVGNMNAMFQNGKLVSKAQFGL
jgi:hypothetical protein